jgi:hypothetical protein
MGWWLPIIELLHASNEVAVVIVPSHGAISKLRITPHIAHHRHPHVCCHGVTHGHHVYKTLPPLDGIPLVTFQTFAVDWEAVVIGSHSFACVNFECCHADSSLVELLLLTPIQLCWFWIPSFWLTIHWRHCCCCWSCCCHSLCCITCCLCICCSFCYWLLFSKLHYNGLYPSCCKQ